MTNEELQEAIFSTFDLIESMTEKSDTLMFELRTHLILLIEVQRRRAQEKQNAV